MDTNYYDVVVCGTELTGFITAALLARRGFRVLVLGHDADRPTFDAAGHTLSRAPGLLPPLEAPAVSRVLKELNYVQILRRRAPVLSPSFQIALRDHRLDVTADRLPLLHEIERELPDERAAADGALARMASLSATIDPILGSDITLPPDGFWERREIARLEGLLPEVGADVLSGLAGASPLRAAFAAPAALGASFGPGDLGSVGTARAFEVARHGLHRLEGGYAALRGLFLDKIETYSGELREKVTPVEVVMKRGRAAGVRVRPRDETIGCTNLIWAAPLGGLLPLFGEKPPRRLRDMAAGLRPACYRYTLCLLLRPEALPVGMAARVYAVADPSKPLIEENALAVTVGEPSAREPDKVPLWVECLVPAPAVDGGPGYLGALRQRLRGQLARLVPFFTRHLLVLASPHDGLPPEAPAPADPAAPAPGPLPAIPMEAVYSVDLPRALDVGGVPHATGLRGLYTVSRENLPGLGIEGEFISAWGAARLITSSQPKKDLLRREVLLGES